MSHDVATTIVQLARESLGLEMAIDFRCMCNHSVHNDYVVLTTDHEGVTVATVAGAPFVLRRAKDIDLFCSEMAEDMHFVLSDDDDGDVGHVHCWCMRLRVGEATVCTKFLSSRQKARLAKALAGYINLYGLLKNCL